MESIDLCKECTVSDDYDPGDPDCFTCSDCACYTCEYLHACVGQCQQME